MIHLKKDFMKIYHQHGAEVNIENQHNEIHFGGNLSYIQVGNPYLEIEIEVEKGAGTTLTIADYYRPVNIEMTYIFQEVRLSRSSGTETEQNSYLGPVSTIMRLLTHKDGDLSSFLDKVYERELILLYYYLIIKAHAY